MYKFINGGYFSEKSRYDQKNHLVVENTEEIKVCNQVHTIASESLNS